MVNEFVAIQSPARQISPRRRRQLQPFVIVARHLAEQRHVVCRWIQRTRQTRHGGLLLHGLRREHGIAALPQQLEGVPERNAVMVLHELDGVARLAARHAVEQPLVRRNDEVRFVAVVVERTTPDKIFRAVFLQLDAPALHQRHQIGLAFGLIQIGFRNAPGHGQPPFWKQASRVILSLFARPSFNSIPVSCKLF